MPGSMRCCRRRTVLPSARGGAMSRYQVVLTLSCAVAAALVCFVGWWAFPYIRYPVLLTDEGAITAAIGDAAGAALLREATGIDVFRSGQTAQTADFDGVRGLCTATELRSGAALVGSCDPWQATKTPGCNNRGFCAEMRFDPSIRSDRVLGVTLLQTLQHPCGALPRQPSLRPSIVGPMKHALSVDRRLLRCGSRGELHSKLDEIRNSPTTIKIKF